MNLLRALALAVVFLSLIWTTGPRLLDAVAEGTKLWRLEPGARRRQVFGPFYESVQRINATAPPGEPLALVVERQEDLGPALFFNYWAFPRPTKLYFGLEPYRHDTGGPRRIVRIAGRHFPEARLMSYDTVRAQEIGDDFVVRQFDLSEPSRRFVVPLASSGDGPAPDTYTTEGVLENTADLPAAVTVRLHPSGRSAQVELRPREHRAWNDVVYQLFGVMEVGWLEIESDQLLRACFFFVSRPSRDADALQFVDYFRNARIDVPAGGRLWVLNPHDRELHVRLNEGSHRLPPRSLIPLEWVGGAELHAEDDWFAFVSWRDRAGKTYFRWVSS
jgi:hypothetical protein